MEKSPKTIKIPTFLALNQSRSLSGPSKFILKNEKLHQEELLKNFFFLAQFTRTENMSIPKKKKRKKKKNPQAVGGTNDARRKETYKLIFALAEER